MCVVVFQLAGVGLKLYGMDTVHGIGTGKKHLAIACITADKAVVQCGCNFS